MMRRTEKKIYIYSKLDILRQINGHALLHIKEEKNDKCDIREIYCYHLQTYL
jgi:hypothetical protein